MFWWLNASWILSTLGNRSFILTLAIVLALATLAVTIGFTWALRWALDDRVRLTQLTLGTAMLVTLFAAAWLAAARWLFLTSTLPGSLPVTPQEAAIRRIEFAAIIMVPGSLMSIIPTFWFADGLIWLAVFVVRRPILQRLLRRVRKKSAVTS